eukprot:TRINITY_DN2008_c0_g1_i1.p2 TRINITY_DN2008_c0_g1~~TRINITY_DN2008_c0_g1_i1.p2  ORF type:complete len:165 (-),score=34.28 TRINITY_DN2008_c0_g1_i1:182-676(-)
MEETEETEEETERETGGETGEVEAEEPTMASSQRDDFGVRRFTRFRCQASLEDVMNRLATVLNRHHAHFRVDHSQNQIVVLRAPNDAARLPANYDPSVLTTGHTTTATAAATAALALSSSMVCVIHLTKTGQRQTVLDFKKIRGDIVKFHEFYMQMSQMLASQI